MGKSDDSKPTGKGQRQPSKSGEKKNNTIKEVSSFISKIKIQVTLMEKLTSGKQPNWNKIGSKDGAEKIKQKIRSLKRDIPKTAPEIEEQISQLIDDGADVCEKLLKLQGSMIRDEDDVKEVMELARNLSHDVATISTGLDSAISGNSLPNKSPHQASQG